MESKSRDGRLAARVISHVSGTLAQEEMSRLGAGVEGARIMSGRAEFAVVRLDGADATLARRIKEHMQSFGADAALSEPAWAGDPEATPVLIMGTRRQYKDLLKALASDNGGGARAAEAVAGVLDLYRRTAFSLRLPSGTLELSEGRPVIMGILNVTPDSFSDGGRFLDARAAVEQGLKLVAEGAGIIDVGGESTRPGSAPVDAEEEARRVMPVIEALAKETPCPISIDTCKASVARKAIAAGASIINDVTALSGDADMPRAVAEAGCPVVLMHMKGTPLTMQKSPFYSDLMGEITQYLREALDKAVSAGIDLEQTVVDPGIGFGKTAAHNIEILRRLKELSSLGRPILVGPSRKSFIGEMLGIPPAERVYGTAAAVALATAAGAKILRVHDAAAMRQTAMVAAGIAAAEAPAV